MRSAFLQRNIIDFLNISTNSERAFTFKFLFLTAYFTLSYFLFYKISKFITKLVFKMLHSHFLFGCFWYSYSGRYSLILEFSSLNFNKSSKEGPFKWGTLQTMMFLHFKWSLSPIITCDQSLWLVSSIGGKYIPPSFHNKS